MILEERAIDLADTIHNAFDREERKHRAAVALSIQRNAALEEAAVRAESAVITNEPDALNAQAAIVAAIRALKGQELKPRNTL